NRVFRDDASGHFVRLPDRPNEGIDYYHTLFALPDVLWEHADERNVNGDDADLDGLLFDATPPEGGTPVEEMSIDYPEYGPRQIWRFDKESGRWLSWTEMQLDRPYEATEDVDYNTGEQLAFDNVVILWIPHFWRPDFIEVPAIDVEMIGEGEAVLLRDGLRYDVKWRRESPEHLIQLVDDAGNLVALKPGTTWFHAASTEDPFVSPPDKFVPQVTYGPGVVAAVSPPMQANGSHRGASLTANKKRAPSGARRHFSQKIAAQRAGHCVTSSRTGAASRIRLRAFSWTTSSSSRLFSSVITPWMNAPSSVMSF